MRVGVDDRLVALFRRCLVRPPNDEELAMLREFHDAQKRRLEGGELKAAAIAGPGDGDAVERAAWTLVARAVLNVDEMVVKD